LGRQYLTEGAEHNRGALGTIANNRVEARQNPPGGNADIGIPVTTLLGQGSPVDIQGRDPDALGRNRVDDSSCAAP
jgi:hypothetical protein